VDPSAGGLIAMNNFVEAFRFIGRNGQVPGAPPLPTLVHLTLETLKIAGIAMAVALVIAIPLGVWLGHIHRGSFVAINVGNIWRALPSLAVLAIGGSIATSKSSEVENVGLPPGLVNQPE